MSYSVQKLIISFAILAATAMVAAAIECYNCEGPMGEAGGCGQDPWSSLSMSAPDVETTIESICYVCRIILIFLL